MKKDTLCVHAGSILDPASGGVNTPVYTSSAFNYRNRERIPYPRYFNTPNQDAVVNKLCSLEGAESGLLFSSGMAAISTSILAFATAGDHVVLMDELYGGTHAFATDAFDHMGLTYSFAATDADAICEAATAATKVIVIESPTNPLLSVVDIKKIATFAQERGIITLIDNTFASPVNQNPIALGIDIVAHSGTKYLGGHSDLCCGAIVASAARVERIHALAKLLGGSLNATDCALLERSMKTLGLRVERQSANAMRLAEALAANANVTHVYYPGLADTNGHDIACRQMTGFGGMLSFELVDTIDPEVFIDHLALIKSAVSLGGVETTICSPAQTSHRPLSPEDRARVGVTDALLRLSVGIEDADDLIRDLLQAMAVG